MPKDTKSSGNNKAPACESRGFGHKKEGENFDTPSFSPNKMQKQGIKVPPTWLINFSADPSGLRADPGLHLSRARVSVAGTPGSQAVLQTVFDKRKACLDEKRSRFNMFCTCFRTVTVFIV